MMCGHGVRAAPLQRATEAMGAGWALTVTPVTITAGTSLNQIEPHLTMQILSDI